MGRECDATYGRVDALVRYHLVDETTLTNDPVDEKEWDRSVGEKTIIASSVRPLSVAGSRIDPMMINEAL